MTVVFDKLSFMRHLESEGTFARPQAEKLSEAFHQAVRETVASQADIARLEAVTQADIARLEASTRESFVRLEARIDSMDARVDAKLAGMDAKMARLEGKLDAGLANSKVWTVGVTVALFSALSAIRFFGH